MKEFTILKTTEGLSDDQNSESSVVGSQRSSRKETTSTVVPISYAAVTISIIFYSIISLSIVFFNFWLFTSAFKFPVFISWIQQLFGLFIFIFFGFLGQRFPIFAHFPYTKPNWETAKRVIPLSLCFIGMVSLANICLKFAQVSTYQVARSLTIFFTMVLSYFILNEVQNPKTVMSCVLIVVGFFIGSLDTGTLPFIGVLAGGASSTFQASYNVAIKKALQYVDNNPNLLLYYNLWISIFFFIPLIFISGEGSVLFELNFNPTQLAFFLQWGSLFLTSFLATSMNLSAYWCVKVTSPLTFNIVGLVKSIIQSFGGVVFFGDLVSVQSILAIILSLGGSAWYSWLKIDEASATKKQIGAAACTYDRLEMRQDSFDLEKAVEEELALVELSLPALPNRNVNSNKSHIDFNYHNGISMNPIEPITIGAKHSTKPDISDSDSNSVLMSTNATDRFRRNDSVASKSDKSNQPFSGEQSSTTIVSRQHEPTPLVISKIELPAAKPSSFPTSLGIKAGNNGQHNHLTFNPSNGFHPQNLTLNKFSSIPVWENEVSQILDYENLQSTTKVE